MKLSGFAFLTAVALFACAGVFAADSDSSPKKADVTLRGAKELKIKDAYILDKRPNGVTIAYKGGCMFVFFSDLPREFQQMFGYDAIKSARYENKANAQKKLIEMDEKERKAREQKRNEEKDKRYKDPHINAQQQMIDKLELELNEAKKRLEKTTGSTTSLDRNPLGMSSVGSTRVSIESPWGYGGLIRSGEHNAAVTNKLMKEVGAMGAKRDNPAQDVIDLQLKLEAAQRALDKMLEEDD